MSLPVILMEQDYLGFQSKVIFLQQEERCLNNLPDNKIFVAKVRVGHCTNVMYVNCE